MTDSNAGQTTIVNILTPAQIGDDGIGGGSLIVQALHGGNAQANVFGGTFSSSVRALDNSCLIISDGTFGAGDNSLSSISLEGGAAVVDVANGTFAGPVIAASRSRVTISGGSFGQGSLGGNSLSASGLQGFSSVEVSGGSFAGSVFVARGARVTISNGSFGANGANSVDVTGGVGIAAFGNEGLAAAEISGGTFVGTVRASRNGQVTISGGTFGEGDSVLDPHSAKANGISGGTPVLNISGGSFDSAVAVITGGRARITGGAFGMVQPGAVVIPRGSVGVLSTTRATVAELFGGTFPGGLDARGSGATIHVYGDGLAVNGGVLTGTLADGTPINTVVTTVADGRIILHSLDEIPAIPAGFGLSSALVGTGIFMPSTVVSKPACSELPTFIDFQGVALGKYDFGGVLGVREVGLVDTIIRRDAMAVNLGQSFQYQDTIALEMVALQLQSREPVDLSLFGLTGSDHLFLTLQSNRGLGELTGQASSGEMTIDFAMRELTSSLDVFFDVRIGALDGPILFSDSDVVATGPVPWAVDAPEGALVIKGVNDGFFPGVIGGTRFGFRQQGGALELMATSTANIPEPSTFALAVCGLLSLGFYTWRRRRRA